MNELFANYWLANFITAGVILTILSWLWQRFVKSNDRRIEEVEAKADEIEKNYIRRFEDVHHKIDETKEELKDHFTREIKEVTGESHRYKESTSRELGTIAAKIDTLLRNTNSR